MEEKDYLNMVEDLTSEQLVEGILLKKVTFLKLQKTEKFDYSKQRKVKELLKKKGDDTFAAANTITAFENYLWLFPDGDHKDEANKKISLLKDNEGSEERKQKEREKIFKEIKNDINEYTPDEIIDKLSNEDLDDLCNELGIDIKVIKNYTEPTLRFNDIPQIENDIPIGYTDVFFWGIPSAGKTCALSAIFSTIKKNYSMEAPDSNKKFGATYRDSLINIFSGHEVRVVKEGVEVKEEYGFLPDRTNEDRTQYMPFLFYRRGETNKRKVSFFELSGEVFKYFYEVANNSRIIKEDLREQIEKSFQTLNLLLKSSNQKIHFFFIDYNQETKYSVDKNGLTQSNYLEAASSYFRDNSDIFKKKTDAVYVVVTKSDAIKGNNTSESAKSFLDDNFGSFMDVLKNQCKNNSVEFRVKIFSIGSVYFKKICKINRAHSIAIIEDLLNRVKPTSDSKFKNFFNS